MVVKEQPDGTAWVAAHHVREGTFFAFFGGTMFDVYRLLRVWRRKGAALATVGFVSSGGGISRRYVVDLDTGVSTQPLAEDLHVMVKWTGPALVLTGTSEPCLELGDLRRLWEQRYGARPGWRHG